MTVSIDRYLTDMAWRLEIKRDPLNNPVGSDARDAVCMLMQWELIKALTPALSKPMHERSPWSSAGDKQHGDLIAEAAALAGNFMSYIEDSDED